MTNKKKTIKKISKEKSSRDFQFFKNFSFLFFSFWKEKTVFCAKIRMNISNRPQTAPSLESIKNNLTSSISSNNQQNSNNNNNRNNNRPKSQIRYRSPVPHSFRSAIGQKGNSKNINETSSNLMIRSNSTSRQISSPPFTFSSSVTSSTSFNKDRSHSHQIENSKLMKEKQTPRVISNHNHVYNNITESENNNRDNRNNSNRNQSDKNDQKKSDSNNNNNNNSELYQYQNQFNLEDDDEEELVNNNNIHSVDIPFEDDFDLSKHHQELELKKTFQDHNYNSSNDNDNSNINSNNNYDIEDIDNHLFHELRKKSYETTSERDKAALKIGRLILSTILSKPEVTVADSISRFFTDVWLSKSGTNSNLSTTDTMSINLLSNLHRSMTANNLPPDASIKQVAASQKSIAAVACEALDTLILTFGQANPILTDIREALMPVIFMTLPPDPIDQFKSSGKDINAPLTGNAYRNLPTWCEDTASLIQELQDFEKKIKNLQNEKDEIEEKCQHAKSLYEQMVQENGHAQGKILSSIREQERLRDLYRNLKYQNINW